MASGILRSSSARLAQALSQCGTAHAAALPRLWCDPASASDGRRAHSARAAPAPPRPAAAPAGVARRALADDVQVVFSSDGGAEPPPSDHEGAAAEYPRTSTPDTDPHYVAFPPVAAGAVILGAIAKPPAALAVHELRQRVAADVFDQLLPLDNGRTGSKQLKSFIRGPYVFDYYLDKHRDPLDVNVEGQERQEERRERNEKGFKRRRPQPGGGKTKKKKK